MGLDAALEAKLNMTLSELNLSVRAGNCLEVRTHSLRPRSGVSTEDQLLEVRNFGETTLAEVQQKLSDLGLHLGMRVSASTSAVVIHFVHLPRDFSFGPVPATRSMRHRNKGRKLGRNPNHQRALLRNLASALFLTERDAEFDDNKPKVKGRIVTTIAKAKEVRPLVEKCITIARRSIPAQEAAAQLGTSAERGSQEWKSWRTSDQWSAWNEAMAPAVAARRRCLQLLGDKQAVSILFAEIAPRFVDRPGGYTRIVRLAQPRLGDAGTQAILEFVGVRDRVVQRSRAPLVRRCSCPRSRGRHLRGLIFSPSKNRKFHPAASRSYQWARCFFLPGSFAMESPRRGFDFTAAMRRLCGDMVARSPDLAHIDVTRIAFGVCQTRRDVKHGMYASLTPLRFQAGLRSKTIRGVQWQIPTLSDDAGHEFLYVMNFYLPRFQNTSLEDKLSTVVHELWHISPQFDGDVRRHAGRCYAHGPSQRDYDARMDRIAQDWLSRDPPAHLYEFLSLDFAALKAEHGRIHGTRWPAIRLVRG